MPSTSFFTIIRFTFSLPKRRSDNTWILHGNNICLRFSFWCFGVSTEGPYRPVLSDPVMKCFYSDVADLLQEDGASLHRAHGLMSMKMMWLTSFCQHNPDEPNSERFWTNVTLSIGFSALLDFTRFSESFNHLVYHKWWTFQILCHFKMSNRAVKIVHLFIHTVLHSDESPLPRL